MKKIFLLASMMLVLFAADLVIDTWHLDCAEASCVGVCHSPTCQIHGSGLQSGLLFAPDLQTQIGVAPTNFQITPSPLSKGIFHPPQIIL